MWRFLLFLFLLVTLEAQETVFYDTYYGTPLTMQEMVRHVKENTTFWCTIEVDPICDPREGRRIDGTCNNLNYPSRGGMHTPFVKLLPQEFSPGFEPRLGWYGEPLPLARRIRTTALATGIRPDLTFTQMATHFFVFTVADIATIHDTVDYVIWRPYCCLPRGQSDPACIPQEIPLDDPVHRFSNIRCQNLTRPITYQSSGCVSNMTFPDKITSSTPAFDMSSVYGNDLKAAERARLGIGGLLKYEVEDGRIFPPRMKTMPNSICLLNQPPRETRCHDTPDVGANSILGINLFVIWFWRNHNNIVSTLADLNPCWSDEKLYQTAREINIASELQMFIYEFLPVLLGKHNLLMDSLISADGGFRDMYDSRMFPTQSSEYPYVLRWVHTMQDGRLKMYDPEGYYLKQVPLVNVTLRSGFLAIDDNLDYITQGSFRQASGKIDYIIDPDIGERIVGGLQHMSDVATNDLVKARYFGFPPYVKYRKFCSGKTINSFHDLADIIPADNLELLKDLYDNVNDVELMAGIWLEKPVSGGFAPPTFYCVVVEQLLRSIKSDRHWYERPNRPHAFTKQQLQEIRKVSVAQLLCDVGDKVTHIQRRAFLRATPANKIVSCNQIPKMNLAMWKDNTCERLKDIKETLWVYDKQDLYPYPGMQMPFS